MNAFAAGHATGSLSGQEQKPAARFLPALRIGLVTVAAICLLSPLTLRAATDDDLPADAQPPANARAVRLSSVEGQVRLAQDGQVIADPAYNNLPVFEGSQITTGEDGRAEIQLEDGSLVRLSPNSAVTFPKMKLEGTSTHTEVVLNGGLAYFELQPSIAEHSLRVNYGPASFVATGFSVVRIQMDKQPGSLAVFSGNVHLERGDALQLDIHGGESLSLSSTDQTRYDLAESIQQDSWDSWNADRDQLLNTQADARTAATGPNSNAPGMSDLDANGNWYDVPGSGYVWSPYDAQLQGASFDPYGYGRWVNYPGYGYLWNSGYNWGYAPFQCGLWNYYDNFGWGWAPGGGCNPWWGQGFYGAGYYGGGGGWGYRLGNYPPGYHPPRRPLPGPIHPRPGPHPVTNPGQNPIRVHGGPVKPPVGVDHRSARAIDSTLTSRPQGPVTIAGQTVEPLHPVAPRQAYTQPGNSFVNRSAPPQPGQYTIVGRPSPPVVPARPVTGQPTSRPYSPPPASRPQPSYGGGGGHMPSGGGGGGGAPHSAPAPAPSPHK